MKAAKHTLPKLSIDHHALAEPARAQPTNFQFEFETADDGTTTILPKRIGGPGGLVDYNSAYRLTIPAGKVYRITYHIRWTGHSHVYVGFYDEKRDDNFPMYHYRGGSGYGTRSFVIEAEPEDLDYIIHCQFRQSIGLGIHLPWRQVPADTLPGETNTVRFLKGDSDATWPDYAWLSWGVMN